VTEVVIQVDLDKSCFVLSDCASFLTKNRRLLISLRRLRFETLANDLLIPYEEKAKIATLDEIQRLLSKFGHSKKLSEETLEEVESFEREERLFDDFSSKALSIRNNEFEKLPELVEDFRLFQEALDKSLKRTLYPLQNLAAFHMAFSQNSCNFAVPGAGKTSVVYGAYAFLKQLPEDDPRKVDKLLVVGPLSSFAPWEIEYFECFGTKPDSQRLSGDIHISREHKEQHLYSGNPAELTLIFHGGVVSLQLEIIDFLKTHRTMVVVDEAHRIKNPDGVWGKSSIEIAKEAKARVILTGTPVPNGYEDLFNLYQFIYPYKFKEILGFNYASLVELTKSSSPDSSRVGAFRRNVSPFFIRIKKKDLNLPPIVDNLIEVNMNSKQRAIYDFIESTYIKSFRENSSATVKDVLNKAKLIRLRQAATNPSLLVKPLKSALYDNPGLGEADPNAKFLNYSDEFIDDSEFFHHICNYSKNETPEKFVEVKRVLDTNIQTKHDKFIIWTIFIQNAKSLQTYLEDNSFVSRLLIGEVPQEERESIIERFNNPQDSEFQVLIANPFAVSESISLHKGCHNAIYLERDYNCSNFLQSKDRIHRVGLPPNQVTHYYYIIAKDSIDSVIDRRLQIKIERMEAIIDEDIPLFSRIDDNDETDVIKELIEDYARRAL